MRKLTPGDLNAKLDRIERAKRSRRWKKAARRHLLDDVGASLPQHGHMVDVAGYTNKVCLKRRFPSFSSAFNALMDTHDSPNSNREETRIYPCRACKAWHLTSQEYDDERRKADTETFREGDPGQGARNRYRIIGQGVLRGSQARTEGRV